MTLVIRKLCLTVHSNISLQPYSSLTSYPALTDTTTLAESRARVYLNYNALTSRTSKLSLTSCTTQSKDAGPRQTSGPKQATRVKNRRAKQAKRLSLLMSKPYRRQHLGKAILQVPIELTSMIAEYLSLDDICSLRLTCVKFSVALTPHVASKIRGLTVAFDDAGCEEMESFV